MPRWYFILLVLLSVNHFESVLIADNVALRKRYTLSPTPNYPHCTDPDDKVQLTDGKTHSCKWLKKSTVGWMKASPTVDIVVDLGEKLAVYEVRIHTVGGGFAGVYFPRYLAVLISDDGREFHLCGIESDKKLTNLQNTRKSARPAVMNVKDINAAGRYVKLVMRPNVRFLFLDEIEVIGEPLATSKKLTPTNKLYKPKTIEELLGKIESIVQLREAISETTESIKGNNVKLKLPSSLSAKLLNETERISDAATIEIKEVLQKDNLDNTRNKLGIIRSGIYRQYYKKPFVCLPANPMEILYEKEMIFNESPAKIDLNLWQGEYESAAFNIINCCDEPLEITVSISPLTGPRGQTIASNNVFTIRRAIYVQANKAGSIGDALILQNEKPFTIAPGQLTQIWLSFFNPTLKAGEYKGKIAVLATRANGQTLPIETVEVLAHISENKFPEKIALNVCNWAYYRAGTEAETAQDLNNHYTNVCVFGSGDIPFPRLTSDRPGIFRKPDYSKIDKILARHKYARTHFLFLNFREDKKDWGRFGKWMTQEWKTRFSLWLWNLVNYLKKSGLSYEQWALHPFDETLCDEFYDLAKLVKKIDPNIRIYANSFGKNEKQIKRFRNLVDIWCPLDNHCKMHPDKLKLVKSFGKEVWTYAARGPGKANDPYQYYRLQPWRAFKRGQNGVGFWVYHDGGKWKNIATPWDDTTMAMGHYGVIYGGARSPLGKLAENIIPSRRWEAWREGIEDYQYLCEVQREITETKKTAPIKSAKAQQQLDSQIDQVLRNPKDKDAVYKTRRNLSELLLSLKNKTD